LQAAKQTSAVTQKLVLTGFLKMPADAFSSRKNLFYQKKIRMQKFIHMPSSYPSHKMESQAR
jgi:hypothetical protein